MSRVAVISDIHGNITALNEVLKDIKKRNIDKIYCLGDMIIKCSSPRECVEKIFDVCDVVIKGNCEERGVDKPIIEEHIWNKEKLTEEQREKISALPYSYDFYMSGYKIRLMHASPRTIHEKSYFWNFNDDFSSHFDYMFENTDFLNNIGQDKPDIVIFGHIHRPILLSKNDKLLINPGAISNSSDMLNINNNVKSYGSYLILEGELNSKKMSKISYKIIKFTYNNFEEANKILESDMPNKKEAAEEIITGKYFNRLKLNIEAEKKKWIK